MSLDQEGLVEWIMASEHRRGILKILAPGGKSPTEISKAMRADLSLVSRALTDLEDKALIKCAVPAKKGKVYVLTEKAYRLMKTVDERTPEKYIDELSKTFKKENIEYARQISLEGMVGPIKPVFVIFETGEPILALEAITNKVHIKRGIDHVTERLKSIAFDFQATKEKHGVEAGVVFLGINKNEADKRIIETADLLKEGEYLDYVYFHDQIEDLISDIKDRIKK